MTDIRPRLSLVLIMRDAAAEIRECLASCAEAVDEMVVCDTGSQDGSVSKAKKFLRRWQAECPADRRYELCRFKWRDDFAAARNHAIARAHGAWMLILDSDERLVEAAPGEMRRLLAELLADRVPAGCTLDGPLSAGSGAPDVLELWRQNVDRQGNPLAAEPDDLAVRLARLAPGLRYRGQVHEQLIWQDGRELRAAAVSAGRLRLLHTGYSEESKAQKDDRNARILLREAQQGGSTYLLDYYLALLYLERGELELAARRAEASIAGNKPVHDSFAPWRILYEARSRQAGAARHEAGLPAVAGQPVTGEAPAEQAARQAELRVDEVLERGIAAFPYYPEFYYFRGGRRWNAGREAEGLADMERSEALAASFRAAFPDQEDGMGQLMPSLREALAQMRHELRQRRVLVIVPTYKRTLAELAPTEVIALRQLRRVLGHYPMAFLVPEGLVPDYGGLEEGFTLEAFPARYFRGAGGYSRLLLEPGFYRRFTAYEYILIHQLDAFVFEDRLAYFCSLGYDYIGAPVPKFEPTWHMAGARIGNGGLSLRRVQGALSMLEGHPELLASGTYRHFFLNIEDLYWGYCGAREELPFRVPDVKTALSFAVQDDLQHALKRLAGGWRPFGCHAWQKFNTGAWRAAIEAAGYDLSGLPDKPVSIRLGVVREFLASRGKIDIRLLYGALAAGRPGEALSRLLACFEKFSGQEHGADWARNVRYFTCLYLRARHDAAGAAGAQRLSYELLQQALLAAVLQALQAAPVEPVVFHYVLVPLGELAAGDGREHFRDSLRKLMEEARRALPQDEAHAAYFREKLALLEETGVTS